MAVKTTIYLSEDLKAAVEREAAATGSSEAEVIRGAIRAAVASVPARNYGIVTGEPFADRADELLAGFGER